MTMISRFFKRCSVWLVIVLVASNVGLVWYLLQHTHELAVAEFREQYPYIDLARNFISQEQYLSTIQPLRTEIKKRAAVFESTGRKVSLYIEYANTGANIIVNQDTYVFPASLVKLPIAIAAMKKVEDGEWNLDNELVLFAGDADIESGRVGAQLGDNPIGTRFSIRTLIEYSLVYSDNTASNILLRNVGDSELRAIIDALGLEALFRNNGALSVKEYTRILRALYSASYLDRESSQYVLELMDASTFNEFLTYGVDESVKFPHKYGEHTDRRVFADSGILYIPERPVLISVVVEGDSERTRSKRILLLQAILCGIYQQRQCGL